MSTLSEVDLLVDYLIDGNDQYIALDAFSSLKFFLDRIASKGIESLIDDFDRLLNSSLGFADSELEGLIHIRNTLQMSQSVLASDIQELQAQLYGRLLRYDVPVVRRLLEDINQYNDSRWLQPLLPSLAAPEYKSYFTLKGHGAQVSIGTFFYDGRSFVSAGSDSQIILWDLDRRSVISRIPTNGKVTSLAAANKAPIITWVSLSPIYSISATTAIVWNTDFGTETCKLIGHMEPIQACAVNSNGRFAATIDQGGVLIVWRLPDGNEIARHDFLCKGIFGLSLDSSGKRLFVTERRSDIMSAFEQMFINNTNIPDDNNFDVDDSKIIGTVFGIEESKLRKIWSISFETNMLSGIRPQSGQSMSVDDRISDDGKTVAFILSNEIRLLTIGNESPYQVISIDSLALHKAISFDSELNIFGIADNSGRISWGDVKFPDQLDVVGSTQTPNFHIGLLCINPVTKRAVFSIPDGALVVSESKDANINWSEFVSDTTKNEWALPTHALPVAVSSSGSFIAFVSKTQKGKFEYSKEKGAHWSSDRWVVQIEMPHNELYKHTISIGDEQPLSIEISNDEDLLLVNIGSHIQIWEIKKQELKLKLKNPAIYNISAFDLPTDETSLSQYWMTKKPMVQWMTAVFSPDDSLVAACSPQGKITIFELLSEVVIYDFHSGLFATNTLTFVGSSSRIAIGGQDASIFRNQYQHIEDGDLNPLVMMPMMQMAPGTVRMFDLESSSLVQHVENIGLRVNRIQVDNKGQEGVLVTQQGMLHRWNVESGELVSSFFVSRFVPVECLVLSSNGKFAVTGGFDGVIRVWDIASEVLIASFTVNSAVHMLAGSKNLSTLVASDGFGWRHILVPSNNNCWNSVELKKLDSSSLKSIALEQTSSEYYALAATRFLAKYGNEGVNCLSHILDRAHEFPFIRADRLIRNATQALKQIAKSEGLSITALEKIKELTTKETDSFLRGYILESIIGIDSPKATEIICQVLASKVPADRFIAVGSLGSNKYHARHAVDELAEAAKIEEYSSILSIICNILANVATPEARIILINLATTSKREEIQNASLEALNNLPGKDLLAILNTFARNKNCSLEQKKIIINGIGEIGANLVGEYNAFTSNKHKTDSNSKIPGIFLLREYANIFRLQFHSELIKCVSILRNYYNKLQPEEIRKLAIMNLGKIVIPPSGKILIKSLNDKAPKIRKTAIIALGHFETNKVCQALTNCFKRDQDAEVREACVETLSSFQHLSVFETIVSALNDKEPNVRKAAIIFLAKSEDYRAFLPLLKSCSDESMVVSMSAKEAIQQMSRKFLQALLLGKVKYEDIAALRLMSKELINVERDEIFDIWKMMKENSDHPELIEASLSLLSANLPEEKRKMISDKLK